MTAYPWREPAEETVDLYPNLVVHDGRVTGSITIGKSRLPVWAIINTAVLEGWDSVEFGWSPTEHYGFTAADLAGFLYWLLDARGEFGRLLLVLANAERAEAEREHAAVDAHFAEVHPGGNLCECGFDHPPAWWADPELSAPVVDQLRRCLTALTGEDE